MTEADLAVPSNKLIFNMNPGAVGSLLILEALLGILGSVPGTWHDRVAVPELCPGPSEQKLTADHSDHNTPVRAATGLVHNEHCHVRILVERSSTAMLQAV